MLISRKVTEVSEISHVNLRAGWKELTKPINRSNTFLDIKLEISFRDEHLELKSTMLLFEVYGTLKYNINKSSSDIELTIN